MVKRRLVTAVAVIAAACANDQTAAPASPTTSAPLPTVGLQPGPHSAIADVDLPEGTIQCTTDSTSGCGITSSDPHTEHWHYSAAYDDVVAFLRKRFATGRRYDTHGATWWDGLPPCYDKGHQSPPWGRTLDAGTKFTEWMWSDAARTLAVDVSDNGSIAILEDFDPELIARSECYRA